MPRLRYYKNFEQIGGGYERSEELYHTSTEQRYDVSGESWWSNTNIITNLPDTKIKQAISYHKQMAKMLENELCGRSTGRRVYIPACEYRYRQDNDSLSRKKTGLIRGNLRSTLRRIRRKHGQMAFEACKEGWRLILENYYGETT